jgi:hypothetical protein
MHSAIDIALSAGSRSQISSSGSQRWTDTSAQVSTTHHSPCWTIAVATGSQGGSDPSGESFAATAEVCGFGSIVSGRTMVPWRECSTYRTFARTHRSEAP